MHPKFFRLFMSSAEHYARDYNFERLRLQSPDDRETKVAKDGRLASTLLCNKCGSADLWVFAECDRSGLEMTSTERRNAAM